MVGGGSGWEEQVGGVARGARGVRGGGDVAAAAAAVLEEEEKEEEVVVVVMVVDVAYRRILVQRYQPADAEVRVE